MVKRLLNTKESSIYLGSSKSKLDQDRVSGKMGLPFVRLGRSVRYKIEDLDQYISTLKTFTSTSDTGR